MDKTPGLFGQRVRRMIASMAAIFGRAASRSDGNRPRIYRCIWSGSTSRKTMTASEAPSSFARPIQALARSVAVAGQWQLYNRHREYRRRYHDGRTWLRPRLTAITAISIIQGCLPTSLYSPDAYQTPLGYTLPYMLLAQKPYKTRRSSIRTPADTPVLEFARDRVPWHQSRSIARRTTRWSSTPITI